MTQDEAILRMLADAQSLDELYLDVCAAIPDKTAMVFQQTEITYGQLQQKAQALATAFAQMGVTPDDRIAIILPTRPEFLYIWLAASKLGAAIVGLNFRYTAQEVTYMVNNTQASVLVCINEFNNTDYSAFLSGIVDQIPSLKKFLFLGPASFPQAVDLEGLLETVPDQALIERTAAKDLGDRDNFIIHTSGTTGKPKGAVILQRNILAMLRPWIKNLEITMENVVFCMLPLNHVGGGTILALATLARGAKLVLLDVFDPTNVIDLLRKHKATLFGAVPTVYEILFAAHPDISADMFPDVSMVAYGGSPATPETIAAMRGRFGAPVMACYGSTEVSGFCSYTRRNDPPERAVTAGKPGEGVEMKIVHPVDRRDLPLGEIGEIAIRSEMVFDRYLNLPDETAKAFSDDGWFYTGDLASMDKDGYLTIAGRSKEMFINSGFNVYPKEIEDKLVEHPGVSTAAVIGVPHRIKGEVGWAFVLPVPGVEVCEEDLISHCRSAIADYKVPERIFVEKDLPISPVGKIIKQELKERASRIRQG